MLDWLQQNGNLAIGLTAVSVVMFIGSLIAAPIVIIRLPADYFASERRQQSESKRRGIAIKVFRNILGAILLLAGLAMLVLPGQGVLMVLVGIMLLDFPGKFRLQRWLVSKGKVLKVMNWLRAKWDKPPLQTAKSS